jgi:hypothetical protein
VTYGDNQIQPYRHCRAAPPDYPLPSSEEVTTEHLTRHRDRCGLGPAIVLVCGCGECEVLLCVRCQTALVAFSRSGSLCEHGRLLVQGGVLRW